MTGWIRPIEQLMLASSRHSRVLGITAPHAGAGVSTVSSAVAEMSARWGARTLLLDLSGIATEADTRQRWAPGLGDPKQFLEIEDRSYDVLQAIPTAATLGAFNSTRHLRASLEADFDTYASLVVDIPPILDFSLQTVNPLVAILACDAVIIVCAKGYTTSDHLKQTVDSIKVAGGSILGTVLNDLGKQKRRRRDPVSLAVTRQR